MLCAEAMHLRSKRTNHGKSQVSLRIVTSFRIFGAEMRSPCDFSSKVRPGFLSAKAVSG